MTRKGYTKMVIDANGCLVCSHCKETKLASEFPKNRVTPSGYSYQCKECNHAFYRASQKKHEATEHQRKAAYLAASRDRKRASSKLRYQLSPHKELAKKAIQHLVKQGKLLPASHYRCQVCGVQALDHHHPSYRPDDRLNVIPLCRSCHRKTHLYEDMVIEAGIVALPIGIVRIAITTS